MPKKLPKEAVNYRAARTRQRRCVTCVMYQPADRVARTGLCTLVAGIIKPDDVCDRWEAKPSN